MQPIMGRAGTTWPRGDVHPVGVDRDAAADHAIGHAVRERARAGEALRPSEVRQHDVVHVHGEGVAGFGALDVHRPRHRVDGGGERGEVAVLVQLAVDGVVGVERDRLTGAGPQPQHGRDVGAEARSPELRPEHVVGRHRAATSPPPSPAVAVACSGRGPVAPPFLRAKMA